MTIIGVLNSVGDSSQTTGTNQDDVVVLPITTATQRLFGRTSLSSILIEANSGGTLSAAYQEADTELLALHNITTASDADFSIASEASLVSTSTSVDRTLTILLGGVAGISLLVGGIGVMNIMLVSVTERVREIGLRKALGARPSYIRRQFLLEASILGLGGGALGAGLAVLGTALLPKAIGYPIALSGLATAGAMAVAIGIGLGLRRLSGLAGRSPGPHRRSPQRMKIFCFTSVKEQHTRHESPIPQIPRFALASGAVALTVAVAACGGSSHASTNLSSSNGTSPSSSTGSSGASGGGTPGGAGGGGGGSFPGASGSVAAITPPSMEVQNQQQGQVTVSWTGSTRFSQMVTVPASSVAVGDCITATGTPANGAMVATAVTITQPSSTGSCTGRLRGGAHGPPRDWSRNRTTPTSSGASGAPAGAPRTNFGFATGKVTAVSATAHDGHGFSSASFRPGSSTSTHHARGRPGNRGPEVHHDLPHHPRRHGLEPGGR